MTTISTLDAEKLNLPLSVNLSYINKEVAEKLGLASKYGDVREDGYVFRHYYIRNNTVQELWLSPKAIIEEHKRRVKVKKVHLEKSKKFIKRVKLYLGCETCGYKKCTAALHFDHLDITTKVREISKMPTFSIKAIKNEMRKCRVLCANCHAEHTVVQREQGVFDNEANT